MGKVLRHLIFDLEFSLLIEYILCRTRLTYNCAHLRSTKESLTFKYLDIMALMVLGQYGVILGQYAEEMVDI